jgi:putative endonuclease
MVIVYAIWSERFNRIYVGMFQDIDKRLKEHNAGMTQSTKPFRPWKIIFTERFEKWEKGRVAEKYYKSGIGKQFLKNMVP